MSFDLVALDIMVGFEGYEYAANNFNAPGTYEKTRRKSQCRYLLREGVTFPLNLKTAKGRLNAILFLYDNLPRPLFRIIFNLGVSLFNYSIVSYPQKDRAVPCPKLYARPRLMYISEVRSHLATLNMIRGRTIESLAQQAAKFCRMCGFIEPSFQVRLDIPYCKTNPFASGGCRHRHVRFVSTINNVGITNPPMCTKCCKAEFAYFCIKNKI